MRFAKPLRPSILFLSLFAVATPLFAATPAVPASPEGLVAALYEAVSVPPGEKHDWDRFRSLFAPGARLIIRGASGALTPMTVEEFIARAPDREGFSFVERELVGRMERYGHIAHSWSSYEGTIRDGEKTTIVRGVNSFQMAEIGGRWLVVTIFWEAEGSGGALPEAMLPLR
jgi:hypothetical protein